LANIDGGAARAPCYTAIGALDAAVKGVKAPAILTTTEVGLAAQSLAQNQCAPVIGAVALTVLSHTPIVLPVP
jgi:hypothetical protein